MINRFSSSPIFGEFHVVSKVVPPGEFGVIAVPRAKVAEVARLVHEAGHDIKVIALELLMPEDVAARYERFEDGGTNAAEARVPGRLAARLGRLMTKFLRVGTKNVKTIRQLRYAVRRRGLAFGWTLAKYPELLIRQQLRCGGRFCR